jgi:aspartyl protease family protein
MSVFSVPIEVSDLDQRRTERLHAWVDTGAFYSSLPRPLLESLGIVPDDRAHFMLADGRVIDNETGYLRMRVQEKQVITLVIFAEPESEPLLGAYALKGLALAVDPLNERLVPRPWLPLFARAARQRPEVVAASGR